MGRWDFLADQEPQELKDYVLDQVADKLTGELRAYPPSIDEWLDEAARRRFRRAIERASQPPLETLRVACEIARREMLREYDLIDRFWRSADRSAVLPDQLEEETAHFLTAWMVDAALAFQELAKGKFSRADLVLLVEKVEDRLLRGHRFRL